MNRPGCRLAAGLSAAAMTISSCNAFAACAEVNFDVSPKDGIVDAGNEELFGLYQVSPVLATYDCNRDGHLDAVEAAGVEEDARGRDEFLDYQQRIQQGVQLSVEHEFQLVKPLRAEKPQHFYLREKRVQLGINSGSSAFDSVSGATLSLSDDLQADETIAKITGAAGFFYGNTMVKGTGGSRKGGSEITAYAVGGFVEADGTLDTGPSKLTAGGIGQLEVFEGWLFDIQLISVTPYYQTDFDGRAAIYGGAIVWNGFRSRWGLGSLIRLPGGADFTWSLVGQADYKHVTDPGDTNLTEGDEYVWAGAEAEFKLYPFPSTLDHRFYMKASPSYYYDIVSGRDAPRLIGALGWTFDKDEHSTLEVRYEVGTDRDTNEHQEVIEAVLAVKF